jgi:hypothetical protein
VLSVDPTADTTEVEEDVDDEPPGGALSMGQTTFTTVVEEDVDGEAPRGHYRWVRQRSPPLLKKTSMVGTAAPTINITNVDGGAPWEVPELEIQERPPSMLRNIDDGPHGRCRSCRSESTKHQC